jgi:hypothetical protein
MKKIFFIIIIINFSIFSFSYFNKYTNIFSPPGYYFNYTASTDNHISLQFYNVRKYQLMLSNELLASAWSQERSLMGGQMVVESSNYTHAISSSNAMGLFQIKYLTGKDLNVENLFDPYDNLRSALEYQSYLRRIFEDEKRQIAAYHDGPGAIRRAGMTPSGEAYYLRVKREQSNYIIRPVYSPYILGGSLDFFSNNKFLLDLNFTAAYRKFEFYFDFKFFSDGEKINENNGIIDNKKYELDFDFSILYNPRTIFSYGINKDSLIIRMGLPWQNISFSLGENPFFSYYRIRQKTYISKIEITEHNFLIMYGLKIMNIQSLVGFDIFNQSFNFQFGVL